MPSTGRRRPRATEDLEPRRRFSRSAGQEQRHHFQRGPLDGRQAAAEGEANAVPGAEAERLAQALDESPGDQAEGHAGIDLAERLEPEGAGVVAVLPGV